MSDRRPGTAAPQPKRVLFLEGNTDGTVGGSQRVLLEVIRHLDRARFEPVVLFREEHYLVPEFKALCPVIIFGSSSLRLATQFPALHRRLSRFSPLLAAALLFQKLFNLVVHVLPQFVRIVALLVRERVDLVCLNNAPVHTQWLLACKLLRRPCVSYFRGTPDSLFPLHRRLVGHYDAVLSISQAVTDNAERCGASVERFTLVYDGIDAEAVQRLVTRSRDDVLREFVADPRRPVVGIVNNLKQWKGQHVAVDAMTLLHAKRPDVVCLLIGDVAEMDRDYADHLKNLVRERGLDQHVLFTGRRLDVPDLLAALDVVMHTSLLGEGFPRVILETMILGRPLIASRSGPNVEMVEDGISGYLVPAEDPAALADCIERVLADPDARQAVGQRARQRAEQLFNIDINMRKTEAVFAQLLGEGR
jgi:glycosyltransferase involved in cell wall biosynthesis